MTKRPFKPAGVPQLFPYLTVQNAQRAIDFYRDAFGFYLSSDPAKDEQGNIQHAEMKFGQDCVIMFAPEGSWGSTKRAPATLGVSAALTLYTYCEDVDALYKQAMLNGAVSIMEPNDGFWGDRICGLIDPDGYEWMFATNVADHK